MGANDDSQQAGAAKSIIQTNENISAPINHAPGSLSQMMFAEERESGSGGL